MMKVRTGSVASTMGVLTAAAGAQTDRYWVAPLIGSWNSTASWSLSPGGPVGGGLPQNGDPVFFTTRSICLFDTPIGFPVFARLTMQGGGPGQGRTQLIQSAGLLRSDLFLIGQASTAVPQPPRNDLILVGGRLNARQISVGIGTGGEGLFDVSGDASVGPVETTS